MVVKMSLCDTNTTTLQYRMLLTSLLSFEWGWPLHGWAGSNSPGVEGVLSRKDVGAFTAHEHFDTVVKGADTALGQRALLNDL